MFKFTAHQPFLNTKTPEKFKHGIFKSHNMAKKFIVKKRAY